MGLGCHVGNHADILQVTDTKKVAMNATWQARGHITSDEMIHPTCASPTSLPMIPDIRDRPAQLLFDGGLSTKSIASRRATSRSRDPENAGDPQCRKPDWRVPKNSPGPRSLRSISAMAKRH